MGIEAAQAAGMRVVALTTSFRASHFEQLQPPPTLRAAISTNTCRYSFPPFGARGSAARRPPRRSPAPPEQCLRRLSSHQTVRAIRRPPNEERSSPSRLPRCWPPPSPQPGARPERRADARVTAGTVKVTVDLQRQRQGRRLAQVLGVPVRHAEHRRRIDADRQSRSTRTAPTRSSRTSPATRSPDRGGVRRAGRDDGRGAAADRIADRGPDGRRRRAARVTPGDKATAC